MSLSEANDPQTPPEKLATLAKQPSLSLAVAQNPNTPKEALLRLACQYPNEVLQNPAFSLFLLEDPYLFSSCAEDTTAGLLRSPHAPEQMLRSIYQKHWSKYASTQHPLLLAIAKNPRAPEEFLESFYLSYDPTIRQAAFSNPSTPTQLKRALLGLGVLPSLSTHAKTFAPLPSADIEYIYQKKIVPTELIARHTSTPEKILRELFDLHQAIILENPSAPNDLLLLAFQTPLIEWRTKSALLNPNCPASMLEQFATHASYLYRAAVASNPSTPAALLESLIKDKERSVRRSLAENPATPTHLQLILAKDSLVLVRRALAMRASLPDEVRKILAKDKDAKIKASLSRKTAALKKKSKKS